MLSAVAARKARLAQNQAQTPPQTAAVPPIPPGPTSQPPSDFRKKPSSDQKPPPKRKPSAPAGNATKKRKGQNRRSSPEPSARYFAQPDAFENQEDIIVVNDSDSETSVASQDTPSEGEASRIPPSRLNPRPASRKRAWSPSVPLQDSSDEEVEDADEILILDATDPPPDESVPVSPALLSTFRPVLDQNVFRLGPSDLSANKRTALLLSAGDTVALLGTYSITVLRGTVDLGGVSLNASTTSYPVFAPRSSPIPIIQCRPHKGSSSDPAVLSTLLSRVAAATMDYDAAIILQELHTGIEGLGRICRTFDGFFAPSRWHRGRVTFDLGLDTVYYLTQQTSDVVPLDIPPSWDAAVKAILPTSDQGTDATAEKKMVYIIKGAKNTGKSTFARLILNRLLSRFQRVAYLECDLGQSEFTPGGMVSLNVVEQPVFGPPFSHPSIPYAAHYIGATSPRATPSHYLESIHALVQLFNLEIQNAAAEELGSDDGRFNSSIPLVVNTMGWTKGLGADLARKVQEIVEPSHIFSFDASVGEEWDTAGRVDTLLSPSELGGPHVQSVEPVQRPSTLTHYTAADQRNLSILSYFHAVLPNSPSTSLLTSPVAASWSSTLPLCAQPPYELDPRVAFDQLFLTGAGTEDVTPSEVHRALRCSVVGLVSCQPGTLDSDARIDAEDDARPSPFYEQGVLPPSPHTSKCLGLALVRAISPSPSSRIHLLTPVPSHLLGSARVLVMGELQLPVWGMLDYRTLDDGGDIAGYDREKVPYLRWGKGEGAGGERRRVRRNLMRRAQM
ncbi:hypothetical protein BD311DRAFT_664935 [Dichomitus squalens]|uniref:Polynucleotide 5'-hydroxyl-kinase GRC3 n=1 Tax=Dichomitus squalens TaxID=114155 RepID=A0A4Q9MK03_9APHY|nr:hypothetical protein BD311DRAFT_664935 [Dichomitus squalens]